MVDVGAKRTSRRRALASARVVFPAHVARTLRAGEWKSAKGSVLDTAIISGTMAVKKTHELIPMCHPLMLTGVTVTFELQDRAVLISATVTTRGRTGVEMEALTAVAAAGLTIYDMLKAVDRGMVIGAIQVERKEGGRSGAWERGDEVTST